MVFIRVRKKKKNVLNYHKTRGKKDEKEVRGKKDEKVVREKKKEKMRRQGENRRNLKVKVI